MKPKYDEDFRMKWRLWHFRIWHLWSQRAEESVSHIACMNCGAITHLEVMPVRNRKPFQTGPWEPHNGQIVCLDCSDYDEDFRPVGYAAFQARMASRDWIKDVSGRWDLLPVVPLAAKYTGPAAA